MAHKRKRNNIFEELRINEDLEFSNLGIDFFVMDEEAKRESPEKASKNQVD